ncbi:hypothetical protein BJ912DRAFT_862467 [Pholiota molesta]|nr:hypothetical protein BJ912DRAFT_862467 [Pholiota molesta]
MAEPAPINLAKAFGFHSEPAAIAFAVIYVPLFGWFTRQCFARPTYVYFIINLFCQIRLAAFVLRAILIRVDAVGEKLGPLIADEVLFGVGFFSLLYSAYTLVLDMCRDQTEPPPSLNFLVRLTKNRHVFRVVLMLAVILGVMASTGTAKNGSVSGTAQTERKVSTILFLVLTILQAAQTLFLVQMDMAGTLYHRFIDFRRPNESFGSRNAMTILLAVSLLLLVREGFSTATMTNALKQNNEHFWYPLMAVPEVLIVVLLSLPGLVPRKEEMQQRYPVAMLKEMGPGSSTSLA